MSDIDATVIMFESQNAILISFAFFMFYLSLYTVLGQINPNHAMQEIQNIIFRRICKKQTEEQRKKKNKIDERLKPLEHLSNCIFFILFFFFHFFIEDLFIESSG